MIGKRTSLGLFLAIGLLTIGIWLTTSTLRNRRLNPGSESQRSVDMVCGPRCVQFILNEYGKKHDLIELVEEIQLPNFESGSALSALQAALAKRGIHTLAIRIGPDVRLDWPHPVIIHIDRSHDRVGHFVVRMPSDESDTDVFWSGLEGYQSGSSGDLAQRRSGAILLTSPTPINHPESYLTVPSDGGVFGQSVPYFIAAFGIFLASLILWFHRARSHA